MQPHTFIFMGRSGCGKGTQSDLLQRYLREKDSTVPVFYLETGAKFREFIQKQNYTSKLSLAVNKAGKLQPEFLAIWSWASLFIDKMEEKQHLVIDGSPRKLIEARTLYGALEFYGRNHPYIIFLDVSVESATNRLLARGRYDDTPEDIKSRLGWYESEVLPSVEFLKANPNCRYISINGDQPIEAVHKEIVSKLGL